MDVKYPELGVIEQSRIDAGISVDRLAEESGIARSTLQRRLADEGSFSLIQIRRIARVLDRDPAALAAEIALRSAA